MIFPVFGKPFYHAEAHSQRSPLLNVGMLYPGQVVAAAMKYARIMKFL
jgi:hypothetical protein